MLSENSPQSSVENFPFICTKCHQEITVVNDVPDILSLSSMKLSEHRVSMCEDCMNNALNILKDQIASANNDLSQYTEALFELERDRRTGKFNDDDRSHRLVLLHQKNDLLGEELATLESKEASLLLELEQIQKEQLQYELEEAKLADEILSLNRAILDSDESIETVGRKLLYCSNSLRKLKHLNLISEAFFIDDGLDDHSVAMYGSINGLRIGRGIAWSEINAGWGFLCLLLDVLGKKAGLTVSQYRLLPRGNYSVIIKKNDRSTLELYSDESSNATSGITRFITGRKFDSAMIAFLQVMSELLTHEQAGDSNLLFPYTIEDTEGKIGGLSIALQFNSDENWNMAIKYMLANMKWMISLIEVRH